MDPPTLWILVDLGDQIWGFFGGLALGMAATIAKNKTTPVELSAKVQRLGWLIFIPFIGGWNTYDIYAKWFQSSPAVPAPKLAGGLLIMGVPQARTIGTNYTHGCGKSTCLGKCV